MVPTAGSQPAVVPPAPASEPEEDLQAGDKAGPWIVERELGRGGMGSVYGVTHEEIGKRAALKVMHRRLVTGSSAERILQEARVVNQVGHPNIVDIFETGTLPDGRPYIVMERLEGMPLSYRADEGKILPDQVISMLLQVCDALIAAHAANVVHRDLKLDNVFLIDNPDDPTQPKVKLLDWGIAKIISADVRHTIEGQLVGTPQYLAPEQARGAAVSAQTDVYSLGVMAYELFLEQLPFEAETSAEIMAMHLRAIPPPPSELWPDIPPGLENLLLAMLAKDPDARPTMLTVAHTLELVRSELIRRREELGDAAAATPLPPTRKSTRLKSAPGLAPTEPAASGEWREPSKRWHVVVGAFALAASAIVFLMSREPETAAAASKPATADLSAPTAATDNVKPDVAIAQPETAPAVPEIAPQETSPEAKTTTHARPHHTARKLPVRPRRDASHDPDGTMDPYQ
ncbi:MAG TPA: serine/threonine-protein kinase [Kofleriaceae bacterium]|nr:serine/threonine-protein kinase [Kofleriaceae bacterium]